MAHASVEIHKPGILSTIQDYPGRVGYLAKGFFPAGPMDDVAFRAANVLVGNEPGSPAIEVTLGNMSFESSADVVVAVCGATCDVTIDDQAADQWRTLHLEAGRELSLGISAGPGLRIYIAIGGLLDVPMVLGSRATYTIGAIGGLEGRPLRAGDSIPLVDVRPSVRSVRVKPSAAPVYEHQWELEAMRGPQADPDYMTAEDMAEFFGRAWTVSPQSSRTGIRLEPHKFHWARKSGGVAGGHPSNILDDSYPVGGVDMNGDTPVILGPDGPTAGGFVVLATVVRGALWKLGQLRPGRDTVRFREVGLAEALQLRAERENWPDGSSLETLDD